MCVFCLCLTLDGPLEEGLAGFTGGHTIVVARGNVTAHQTHTLGHRAQHEFTLHWAFFLHKPPERGQIKRNVLRYLFNI